MDPTKAAAILEAMGIKVPPTILGPDGQPMNTADVVQRDVRINCPQCGSTPKRRVRSGGFGKNTDMCGECGHMFDELTVEGSGR